MTKEQIRELRQRLGLTQFQLAVRLGVTLATIQRWEAGTARPSPLAVEKLNRWQQEARSQ